MNILLVCPYDFSRPGGVQQQIRSIAAAISGKGHIVRILSAGNRKKMKNPDYIIGGWTITISLFSTTVDVTIPVSTAALSSIINEVDIIHIHEPFIPFLGSKIIRINQKAKVIATFHADAPKLLDSIWRHYAYRLTPNVAHITAVSEVAARLPRKYLPNREISIIPNGIDIEKYQIGSGSTRKDIVFMGRLEKRKGVEYLIRAYSRLNTTEKLIIIGDGRQRKRLQLLAHELCPGKVQFLGFIDEMTKIRYLNQANLFCSPALFGESFGIVLIEAMAAGAVVLGGDNPGYHQLLAGMAETCLVDPFNQAQFTSKLGDLLNKENLRQSFLNWSKKTIIEYDYSKIGDRYLSIYGKQD